MRGGAPRRPAPVARRRRRQGARRLRAAAPAAAAAPGDAACAVSPDEQVPLTLRLSTRTRTRKTGRRRRKGEPSGAGPLRPRFLLLVRPPPPPPRGSGARSKRLRGGEQLAAHLKVAAACHFRLYSWFSSQGSYLGREPVPFSPEVSLLKPHWPCILHPTPVFAFLTPPEPPVPPLSLPRVCASPSPRPGTWPSQAGGVVTGEPPSVWIAVRTQSTACAILGEGCLQLERQNKSSHFRKPRPRFLFLGCRARGRGVGVGNLCVRGAGIVCFACARVLPSSFGRLRGSTLRGSGSCLTLAQVVVWGWKSKEKRRGNK